MTTEITLENCIAVLEAYRGKDKDLLRAEKLLDDMCKKIIKANLLEPVSLANTKELKEVENILKKKFNAKQFTLHIYDDIVTNTLFGTNGFTMPQALASFRPKNDGLNSGLCIFVNIGQGLISHMKLTGGETLAIILHEIGHNVRRDWLRQFSDIIYTAMDPMCALVSELTVPQHVWMSMPKEIEKISPQLMLKAGKLVGHIQRWLYDISKFSILGNLLKNINRIISSIDPLSYILKYAEEKYADSLPTRFGYGYEMTTVAAKMDDFRRSSITIMKPSPLSIIEDFFVRASAILLSPLDVHPQDAIRVSRQVSMIRKHLKDPSISKEQRKELEQSLNNVEKFLNEVYLNPKHKRNMAAPFTFIWNYITLKLKGYVDIREILNTLRIEE